MEVRRDPATGGREGTRLPPVSGSSGDGEVVDAARVVGSRPLLAAAVAAGIVGEGPDAAVVAVAAGSRHRAESWGDAEHGVGADALATAVAAGVLVGPDAAAAAVAAGLIASGESEDVVGRRPIFGAVVGIGGSGRNEIGHGRGVEERAGEWDRATRPARVAQERGHFDSGLGVNMKRTRKTRKTRYPRTVTSVRTM